MNRREMLLLSTSAMATSGAILSDTAADAAPASDSQLVSRWDCVELSFHGPSEGNPFVDVKLNATFRFKNRAVTVDGFYDGEGSFKIRFMPDEIGEWLWTTSCNRPTLDKKTGSFQCIAPRGNNHGPVSIRDSYHFGYADGTPYVECGTTCYAWAFQPDAVQKQTLQTLGNSPFDKIRMCLFPKWYEHNQKEPPSYPFPRSGETNDYSVFNVAYFQHFDRLISELRALNIQADLILFHPYDKWGYQSMPAEVDDRYLRYVIARYSAFRNVWWSLANEFDLLKDKTNKDWDRLVRIIAAHDAYDHLRSIHYCYHVYEYQRGWCTHAGVQDSRLELAHSWRDDWGKPVVFDECRYEGNIASNWGNESGEEMTRRFWLAAVQGAYCGHGETFLHPEDILWWSHGGVLHGNSPARIAFLRQLLEETIDVGPGPIGFTYAPQDGTLGAKRSNDSVLFFYFDSHQPAEGTYTLPAGKTYTAEYVDTLKLTRTPFPGQYSGKAAVKLPGVPFGSLWFRAKDVS